MLNFKEPTWAHAELFGHSSYFGRVQEVSFCGASGLCIEPLTADGLLPGFFAAGSAIFRLTSMTEDDARHAVLPRAFRACEAFQASAALASNCRVCGRNEPEHQRTALLAHADPSLEDVATAERRRGEIPDASFDEEGDGSDDDIPFDLRTHESAEVTEDDALEQVLRGYLCMNLRHPTEAQAVTLRSGHDKIEIIRAPLASSAETSAPLAERARVALEGTPVANADLLAATLRAPVGVVTAMLEEMGWTPDGHGLWMRPAKCPGAERATFRQDTNERAGRCANCGCDISEHSA